MIKSNALKLLYVTEIYYLIGQKQNKYNLNNDLIHKWKQNMWFASPPSAPSRCAFAFNYTHVADLIQCENLLKSILCNGTVH